MKKYIEKLPNTIRCPECFTIPFLSLIQNQNSIMLEYSCPNSHNGQISICEFDKLKNENFSKKNVNCFSCINHSSLGNIWFCKGCLKYFCLDHSYLHAFHNNIDIVNFDSLCSFHNQKLIFFCESCNYNICEKCKNDHYRHNIININEKLFSEDETNKFELNLKKAEDYLNNFEKIFIDIKNHYEEYKNLISNEIKLCKDLFDLYKKNIKVQKISYQMIENIKKIINFKDIVNKELDLDFFLEAILNKNKYSILESTFKNHKIKRSKSLIPNLPGCFLNSNQKKQNINKKYNINKLNKIYELQNINCPVNQLILLNDGRLASCSKDGLIKIYSKDSLDLIDILIDIHNQESVTSIYQLKNNKIVSTGEDKLIKIINLLPNNEFEIEQTLIGHKDKINQCIELSNNRLISCGDDGRIIIWDNNNNIYQSRIIIQDDKKISSIVEMEKYNCIFFLKEYGENKKKVFCLDLEQYIIFQPEFFPLIYANSLFFLDKTTIIFPPKSYLPLKMINFQEYDMKSQESGTTSTFFIKLNDGTFLSDGKKILEQWYYNGVELKTLGKIDLNFYTKINSMVQLPNGDLVISGMKKYKSGVDVFSFDNFI